MRKFSLLILLLSGTLCLQHLHAGVIPANGATVNVIHVYLETDLSTNAVRYELAFYSDSVSAATDQREKTLTATWPAFYVNDLSWNHRYFWKIIAFDANNRVLTPGQLRSFRTAPKVSYITFDEVKIDVRVNKPDSHAGGFFAIDYAKAIIDRSGKTVWVVPEMGHLQNKETQVRDLKLTNDNSFTLLSNNIPLELDYDGRILWQLPHPYVFGKDTITFHHEFEKVNPNSYVVLGNKKVLRRVIGEYNDKQKTNKGIVYRNDTAYKYTDLAMLFEFNAKGELLWYWDANDYVSDEDLNFKKNPGGFPIFLSHANGFSLSDDGSQIYLSFKELSRIVRIDKKTKAVDRSYGAKFPSGQALLGDGLFMHQHDPTITKRQSILFFNNNEVRNKQALSSIMEIKVDPKNPKELLIWKFDLHFDSLTKGKSSAGGNVVEMPSGNIFLCAGQLNRMFEIRRNGSLLWDAFLFHKRFQDTLWQPFSQYRSSWLPAFKPSHFIAVLADAAAQKQPGSLAKVRICNTSQYTETFVVEIQDKTGKVLKAVQTLPLGEFEDVYVPLDIEITSKKQITLVVYPRSSIYDQRNFQLNID